MKKVSGRFMLLGLVVIVSIAFFLPSYPRLFHALPDWTKQVLPSKGITLGLDLQGGIHLVLEVEEDRAVEIAVDRSVNSIQDFLVDKKIPVESVKRTAQAQVTIEFQKGELKSEIQKALEDFPSFYEVEQPDTANRFVYELREGEIKRIKDSAINQALETIR
ncbi:MAG: protein translocase subunit SecD, partial [Nitrospiraceae bacterium]